MGRVVVVTFDENEEEKNEMNYYIFCLLKNTLRCLVNKIGYLIMEH